MSELMNASFRAQGFAFSSAVYFFIELELSVKTLHTGLVGWKSLLMWLQYLFLRIRRALQESAQSTQLTWGQFLHSAPPMTGGGLFIVTFSTPPNPALPPSFRLSNPRPLLAPPSPVPYAGDDVMSRGYTNGVVEHDSDISD